jgi:hypothetical protein
MQPIFNFNNSISWHSTLKISTVLIWFCPIWIIKFESVKDGHTKFIHRRQYTWYSRPIDIQTKHRSLIFMSRNYGYTKINYIRTCYSHIRNEIPRGSWGAVHAFLTWELTAEWLASRSGRFTSGEIARHTPLIERTAGHRAGLHVLDTPKKLCPSGNRNLPRSSRPYSNHQTELTWHQIY